MEQIRNSEQVQEQTGELLAQGRKRNVKAFVLIGLAVLAAVVVAVIVLGGGSGGRKYNDTVALGEKYFSEGNYGQAETTFLEAIGMNEREVRARKGLAYTYAIQGKYDEAKEIYDALYDETGDEMYQTASVAVSEGRLPSALELVPVPPEVAELTTQAFSEYAGEYEMPLPTDALEVMDLDEYTIYEFVPELSRVRLTLNADGTFAVTADQYEYFVQGVVADGDVVYRQQAQGQFICVGQNDDGAYRLRLVAFQDAGNASEDGYGDVATYHNDIENVDYYVVMIMRPYNMNNGFANAEEFLLLDDGGHVLQNAGGGQTFAAK